MLTFENVTMKYLSEQDTKQSREQFVLKGLNYSFEDKKITAIVGASGIGKTTILNLAAGLIKADGGRVGNSYLKTAYVFQEPRLLPWKTALENVVCVCGDEEMAKKYLDMLLPDEYNKYPDELSGGMKQRVSIARAMAYDADLVLLDEPFKGLDEATKDSTMKLFFEHLSGRTAIIVTHDKSELDFCDVLLEINQSPISELVGKKWKQNAE